MKIFFIGGLVACCVFVNSASSLAEFKSVTAESGKQSDDWSSLRSAQIIDLILQEANNREFSKIVRQYSQASESVKSCELIQYYRAKAQCEYDVQGALKFVRDVMRQPGQKDEHIARACCGLVDDFGRFPRDRGIALEVCDAYAILTKYPSQAIALRARIEYDCGNKKQSLYLMEKAKVSWKSESHESPRDNPPIRSYF